MDPRPSVSALGGRPLPGRAGHRGHPLLSGTI
jgi:hypothetical protein